MFAYEFKNATSSTSKCSATSIATGTAADEGSYTFTDIINLTGKQYDLKHLNILIEVPAKVNASGASCYMDFALCGRMSLNGATFPITSVTGTSLFLTTTAGVSIAAKKYYNWFRPLTTAQNGTTYHLTAVPYLHLGARARRENDTGVTTVYYNAWLSVG